MGSASASLVVGSPGPSAAGPTSSSLRAITVLLLMLSATPAGLRLALGAEAPTGPPCRCERFTQDLDAAEKVLANRGDAADIPLSPAARAHYRASVEVTYALASCLVACES